uniref:DOMON domain-containing protein n=1 Tax=Branchiostoma floridae TaxID=7739 RepID=C3XV46_BRAFL|eukprot:XP_002611963.1 hypothetical protein BRAFLDRAFT_91848 [Branchiostoma floridae]
MAVLLAAVVVALLYSGTVSAEADLNHHEVLDENGDFLLSWTSDDAHAQIELEARVRTRGWVGLGLSPNGGMPGSDIVIGWVKDGQAYLTFSAYRIFKYVVSLGLSPNGGMPGSDIVIGWVKDGQAYLTDRYADEKALPPEDESQDWELLSGYENDTHTVLRFKRKLQTCDVRDRVINKDTMRVLWAWHDQDPDDVTGPAYHRLNRGVRSTVLLKNNEETESLPNNILSYDVLMTNAIIPSRRTTYWCKLVDMPRLQAKHHVFKVQPVITPGNAGMVHHMLVYKCHANPNRTVAPADHPGHQCHYGNMPQDWSECYRGSIIGAWAVGTGDLSFPSHVGYPIGDEDDGGQVLLEVLDENGDFLLFWTYDGAQIELEARVRTRGWVGLGLSPNGGMPGSDIVIGWVKDGQAYLTDRYADEKALPPEDESQDWELLSGYENDTHTVLRFKRKLQTCDVRDRVINKDTQRVLWAWNDRDPDDVTGPAYHTHRGVRSSILLRNDIEAESLPNVIRSHDVVMTNFLDEAGEPIHIFGDMLHAHLLASQLKTAVIRDGVETVVSRDDNYDFNLQHIRMLDEEVTVRKDLSFPSHVGYPIGDEDDGGQVLMEVHYDNPEQKEGD